MRLFIAIDFEKEKEYLKSLQENLHFASSKLTFPKTFHITLKFLGEVTPDKAEKIKECLESVKARKFSVLLDSIGVFPNESYIRVVWIGLNPEEQIMQLQKSIDNSLLPLFKKERNFKAHITLARVKFAENKENFVKMLKSIKVEKRKIDFSEFLLVKSDLKPTGPIYTAIAKFQLFS